MMTYCAFTNDCSMRERTSEADQAGGGTPLSLGNSFSPLKRFTSRATLDTRVNSPRSGSVSTGQQGH